EFVHLLEGRLELTIGSDVTVLETGDSIYFDSNLRHLYRSLDEKTCTAFMVLAYPERNLTERRMDNLAALHGVRKPPPAVSAVNITPTVPISAPISSGKDAPGINGG
ncbi:MAG TPA: cupin domain-containing protein, partial [Terriglobales bacterium]